MTTEDVKPQQGHRGYLCRMPFAWGKGLSIGEAVSNAAQNVSPDYLDRQDGQMVEVFEGGLDHLRCDDLGTVRADSKVESDSSDVALLVSAMADRAEHVIRLARCLQSRSADAKVRRLAHRMESVADDLVDLIAETDVDY